MRIVLTSLFFVAAVVLRQSACSAAFTQYSGADAGTSAASPRPNASTAAAAFQAATLSLTTINFENMASGSINGTIFNVNGVSGVSLTASGAAGGQPSVQTSNSAITGFNTTSGGSRFVQNSSNNDLTFNFSTGISAFGAYVTGLGTATGTVSLTFNDGSSQAINLSTVIGQSGGGVGFIGFTLSGATLLTSVTLDGTTGSDVWGVDDVQFGSAAVPEPASLAMWGLGVIGVVFARRRRNRRNSTFAS